MEAADHDRNDEERGTAGYARAVAFSDGVFAIAITLLVLALDVPDLPSSVAADRLPAALHDLLPQVRSYFIGFAVIGAFWLGHHSFFRTLRGFDTLLLVLNLGFLSFISLMPFTTSLLGRYGDVEIAVIVYALNVIAASAADTAMLGVALHRRLLTPGAEGDPARMLLVNFLPGVVFLCSIPVAVVDPGNAPYVWLGLLFAGPLAGRARRRRASSPGA